MPEPRSRKKAEEPKEEKSIEQKKCFVIMPFTTPSSYKEADHFQKVYNTIIKPAVKMAGFEAVRVDEDKICDSIIDKIWKNIIECDMAICDLSGRNPNVMYELGIRQAYDKPVVLIQDDVTDRIFDVSAISTVSYSSERIYEKVQEDQKRIADAITETYKGKNPSPILTAYKLSKAEISEESVSENDIKLEMLKSILKSIERRLSNIENDNISNKNITNAFALAEKEAKYRSIMNSLHDIDLMSDGFVSIDEIEEIGRKLREIKVKIMFDKMLETVQRATLRDYYDQLEDKLKKIKEDLS